MSWEYSDKVKELFMTAITDKEKSHFGKIENADGKGRYGSIACGDAMVFYFRVEKSDLDPRKDIIVETKYKTFGCTSAIASSEALCLMLEEQRLTPEEALKISNQDIVDFLGGMPTQKIHCSVMGTEVLKVAICDWALKRGLSLAELKNNDHDDHDEGKIVCQCFGLSDNFIKKKIQELSLKNSKEVISAIKAGGGCGLCINAPGGINSLLKEVWGGDATTSSESNKPNYQEFRIPLKNEFDGELKELFSDVNLIEIKENKVYCTVSDDKQKNRIENYLKKKINENIMVIGI